ncbi:MAG: hypothetical protein CMO81_04965 [Waddliaceae bacterium]|nr:hypothetical protein [Waddliaceae bacterium]
MRSDLYQWALILLTLVATALFGSFFIRELFPEYKVYQNAYLEMEEFRSTYTGDPVPVFKGGIQQIVLPRNDTHPEKIDRCVSCHVALKLEHFSPTKVAKDLNGSVLRDESGKPVLVPNENYVWGRLDAKVSELRDEAVNEQLKQNGKTGEVRSRLKEADRLEAMKSHDLGHEQVVDMTKVLAMHPLMGNEERPFELHSMEEYGCVSCHSGNGRGLVTDRAHGPVFDGTYHEAHMGPHPDFTEPDHENDPSFARAFNHKPGHRLLFQTTPLLVGPLMQAKCVQCHQGAKEELESVGQSVELITQRKERHLDLIKEGIESDYLLLSSTLNLVQSLQDKGFDATVELMRKQLQDYTILPEERDQISTRLSFLRNAQQDYKKNEIEQAVSENLLDKALFVVGNKQVLDALLAEARKEELTPLKTKAILNEISNDLLSSGSLAAKLNSLDQNQESLSRIQQAHRPFTEISQDYNVMKPLKSDAEYISSFERGKSLFFSNACYACHRINNLSKGGVGPELTEIGLYYPWYIKESIVWPQSNLKSSTMPNFRLDHEEIEDLMTFLMAQRNDGKSSAEFIQTVALRDWEAGKKLEYEREIHPTKVNDLETGMVVFATEGCASCHKLRGYESNVGFTAEMEGASEEALYSEKKWFTRLFPEGLLGSEIARIVEENRDEILERISVDVRKDTLLEKIEEQYPKTIESMYSNFKFAARAKNKYYNDKAKEASSSSEKENALVSLEQYKEALNRVFMTYIQEYGLGRDIAPRLHWSGVYRDSEWLIGHFRNPASHTAKSIMPVMPFDDSKFYALTHMLTVLGKKNRDETRKVWDRLGFYPEEAYIELCASCHGQHFHGNGPIAEWIYPVPKNLRNATFLRNLTREKAIESIVHGVRGGPMPPWGETHVGGSPVLTQNEIEQLVDWLYTSLPGGRVIEDESVDKWRYEPEDVLEDLKKERSTSPFSQKENRQSLNSSCEDEEVMKELLSGINTCKDFYVDTKPKVYIDSSEKTLSVEDIFDVQVGESGDKSYFVKESFHTAENIEAGKGLFLVNCAHCHGKEGAGNGERAVVMNDAKPRMLSNMPWLRTRDDLRLLRSIKYGVPGTSMTPWGDKTSALQRMQIVVFIRSLTEEKKIRDELTSSLYEIFETSVIKIELARAELMKQAKELESEYKKTKDVRQSLELAASLDENKSKKAVQAYYKELEQSAKLNRFRRVDQLLKQLIEEVKVEQQVYEILGQSLILKTLKAEPVGKFFDLLEVNKGRFTSKKDQIEFILRSDFDSEISSRVEHLLSWIRNKKQLAEKQQVLASGKLNSPQKREELENINNEVLSMQSMEEKLLVSMSQAKASRARQRDLFQAFEENAEDL